MKTSLFASVVFFYAALLLTMIGTPMVLSSAAVGMRHAAVPDVQVWDRFFDSTRVEQPERVARLPNTEAPTFAPQAKRAPLDKAVPDAGMINNPADKLRARTVKA